jgi:hypothetical protein
MSNFDSFTVMATSNSIRALMQIDGVERGDIQTQVFYGGRFPKKVHQVRIEGFHAQDYGFLGASDKANYKMANMPMIDRVTYTVYHRLGD